jgi:hypothetical protein
MVRVGKENALILRHVPDEELVVHVLPSIVAIDVVGIGNGSDQVVPEYDGTFSSKLVFHLEGYLLGSHDHYVAVWVARVGIVLVTVEEDAEREDVFLAADRWEKEDISFFGRSETCWIRVRGEIS